MYLLFSLILFSLAHLYQGWGGVLGVGFVGITLALLYALTGNLFASILWHMLFDVRFSFRTLTFAGTTQQPAHVVEASPRLIDGSEPGPGKRHNRQQRRWHLQKNWKKQPHGQKSSEAVYLDTLNAEAKSEESLLLDTLEEGPERADSAQSNVLKIAPESKEAANTDASTIIPEQPVRGRAAREQLLRDMRGET